MASLFSEEISKFFSRIRSLDLTLPFIASVLSSSKEKTKQNLHAYLEANSFHKDVDKDNPNILTYSLSPEHGIPVRMLGIKVSNAELAESIVPESFIVSLLSQYDAYLGNILKVLFLKQPELINASEKKLTFSELSSFNSIDEAKQYAIEREIDSVIRESHDGQIEWLEKKFGIPFTKGLSIWPTFIEVAERRNLFVHTGGRVTTQYLKVCNDHKVILPKDIKTGQLLSVNRAYFDSACDAVLDLGIKLGHVLWRKIAEDEREEADQHLNMLGYELIYAGEYNLASSIFEFATETIKKFSSEEVLLYLLMNKAQAYKWAGKNEKCKEVVESIDWSAKSPKYQLVRCVLEDNFIDASKYMKDMGSNGEINISEYVEWPIFQNFRQSEIFKTTYHEVFGFDYQLVKTIESDV